MRYKNLIRSENAKSCLNLDLELSIDLVSLKPEAPVVFIPVIFLVHI